MKRIFSGMLRKTEQLHEKVVVLCGAVVFGAVLCGCTGQMKVKHLQQNGVGVEVSMAVDMAPVSVSEPTFGSDVQGSDEVEDMRNDMSISQKLQAVVVEARFRHVAERSGYVDIEFDVKVPVELQRSEWQLRLQPYLYSQQDTLVLDKLYITGEKYRKGQLRGYELYNRFLNSIIPDTCDFVSTYTYSNLLDIFMQRHMMDAVQAQEAVYHYTKNALVKRNQRRKGRVGQMYSKYVKVPLENLGVRLDTVICGADSSLVYRYIQRIKSRREMKRVDLVVDGHVCREDKIVYTLPQSGPFTYYISSMTFFADRSVRYVKRIISRNAVVNTSANIGFNVGDATLCDSLYNNGPELQRIREIACTLYSDPTYAVDSIVITSSCSPEGKYSFNQKLAARRGESLRAYFLDFADSLYSIKSRSIAEDWERLEMLLGQDTLLSDRIAVGKALKLSGYDEREKALSGTRDYPYIKRSVYPLLRTVRFDFHLHRKGMIKDTVHTTEIDTLYMKGVESLLERDYKGAIALLRPYNDINTAIAYVCLDYNNSALQILQGLPKTPYRDYMLAVVWARLGDERKAVECFVQSVEQDPSMRHRGNLDPEVSALIRKYSINQL